MTAAPHYSNIKKHILIKISVLCCIRTACNYLYWKLFIYMQYIEFPRNLWYVVFCLSMMCVKQMDDWEVGPVSLSSRIFIRKIFSVSINS